jgi:hypothetical protein
VESSRSGVQTNAGASPEDRVERDVAGEHPRAERRRAGGTPHGARRVARRPMTENV